MDLILGPGTPYASRQTKKKKETLAKEFPFGTAGQGSSLVHAVTPVRSPAQEIPHAAGAAENKKRKKFMKDFPQTEEWSQVTCSRGYKSLKQHNDCIKQNNAPPKISIC